VGRAEKVRQALVTRGIRPSRILVRGAGSAEPLSAAATPEARALNRRVEVWVTPQRPVAAVTRVHRKVQSREAAAPAWQAARVGQALRRQAKVRTEQASSSEVTFQSTDKVQLGPEALVVIYEDPGQTRRARTDVGDVEVEQGTIFAALAARPGQDRALEVGSRPLPGLGPFEAHPGGRAPRAEDRRRAGGSPGEHGLGVRGALGREGPGQGGGGGRRLRHPGAGGPAPGAPGPPAACARVGHRRPP
jgi:hypothetical protein